jgi:hypothetical protein
MINTYTVDDQKYPAVVIINENAEFITVWQSKDQDGSDYGIFAQKWPQIPSADFSGDEFVNFSDFCILAQEWLNEENQLTTDLSDDDIIDQRDLAAFCVQWLTPC